MSAPTHIRFTQDESAAIDAYAAAHGLRKASAVRALLQLGLAVANAPATGQLDPAAIARIENAVHELGQRLDLALAQLTRTDTEHGADTTHRASEDGPS